MRGETNSQRERKGQGGERLRELREGIMRWKARENMVQRVKPSTGQAYLITGLGELTL